MAGASSTPVSPRILPVMLVLVAAEILSMLEASMLYTALPTITRELGGHESSGWLIAAFMLVQAATGAIGGRLGDMFGRRLMLLIILGICAAGSLMSALAPNIGWVIAGRAVQGVTGAILPLCYGIARQTAPREKLPFWVGVLAAGYTGAAAIGFPLGGFLAQYAGWQSIFYVTVAVPAILAPLAVIFLPKLQPISDKSGFDWLGVVLFMPAVTGMLIAVTYATKWGWFSGQTLALFFGSAALLGIWIWHELRHRDPLFNLGLMRDRNLALSNFCFFLIGAGSMQFSFVVMAMIQQPVWTGVGLGISPTDTGLLKLPSNLIALAAGPVGGWLAMKYGARFGSMFGAAICVAAWAMITMFHGSIVFVTLMSLTVGFGQTVMLATVANLILQVAPADRSSEATGLAVSIRNFGVAVGAQVLAVLMYSSIVADEKGQSFPSEGGYRLALGAITLMALVSLIACVALPRLVRRPAEAAPAIPEPDLIRWAGQAQSAGRT